MEVESLRSGTIAASIWILGLYCFVAIDYMINSVLFEVFIFSYVAIHYYQARDQQALVE